MTNIQYFVTWLSSVPQKVLDVTGLVAIGITALSLFTLYIFSNPKRKHWASLPIYLRELMFWWATFLMVRSVNLTVIMDNPAWVGHLNYEAVFASWLMCGTITCSTYHMLRRTFPPRVWDRINYIIKLAHCPPRTSKVQADAVAELALHGAIAVPPNGGVDVLMEAISTRRALVDTHAENFRD